MCLPSYMKQQWDKNRHWNEETICYTPLSDVHRQSEGDYPPSTNTAYVAIFWLSWTKAV